MLYEDVKVICKVMCSLVKQNVFADLEVGKMFYSSAMLEFSHDDGIRLYFSSILFLYHNISQT